MFGIRYTVTAFRVSVYEFFPREEDPLKVSIDIVPLPLLLPTICLYRDIGGVQLIDVDEDLLTMVPEALPNV